MSRHPISRAITWLAEQYQLQHKDGRVNCSAFGRHSDLPATTIMRLLKADDSWTPRTNTVRRISKAFGVTESQLLGFTAFHTPGLQSQGGGNKTKLEISVANLSDFERLLIMRLRSLRPSDRIEAMHFVEFKVSFLDRAKPNEW